jgi:hypothetical protein
VNDGATGARSSEIICSSKSDGSDEMDDGRIGCDIDDDVSHDVDASAKRQRDSSDGTMRSVCIRVDIKKSQDMHHIDGFT